MEVVEVRRRYRHGMRCGNGWQLLAQHVEARRHMEGWCRENLESDTWDWLEVPPINGEERLLVFRFDRQEDQVLFAMVMGWR